jgi:hypothetical protein
MNGKVKTKNFNFKIYYNNEEEINKNILDLKLKLLRLFVSKQKLSPKEKKLKEFLLNEKISFGYIIKEENKSIYDVGEEIFKTIELAQKYVDVEISKEDYIKEISLLFQKAFNDGRIYEVQR